jgi:hypothetical protein
MVRALAFFLIVFSVLSFVVHLDRMGLLFGTGALSILAIDQIVTQSAGSREGESVDNRFSNVRDLVKRSQ